MWGGLGRQFRTSDSHLSPLCKESTLAVMYFHLLLTVESAASASWLDFLDFSLALIVESAASASWLDFLIHVLAVSSVIPGALPRPKQSTIAPWC